MTYNDAQDIVKGIIAKQLSMDAGKVKPESRLVEDLGLDSFGAVEVAFELEEKFELKIPDSALYEAKTVKDIVDYISSQKGCQ
ncbi:MAG: acyl carrier protein [Candidatus Omnitrophica bacterium]|nr:acyl carrier protein [Candidatus Omnitrophota bacterium]MDE2223055.1 acyl carrier protein [Candidatus Omnitrophota bacterium]